jgi:hypothetical protein
LSGFFFRRFRFASSFRSVSLETLKYTANGVVQPLPRSIAGNVRRWRWFHRGPFNGMIPSTIGEIEKNFKVRLGSNSYINMDILVAYRGTSLFDLKRHDENGYLGIYFEIYDEHGKHVASVKRNEIYYGDKTAYKIDGSQTRYVFSERASGRVLCDVSRYEDAHPAELDVSVHLYTPSGFLFDAAPTQTNLPRGNVIRNCTFEGGHIAISIE